MNTQSKTLLRIGASVGTAVFLFLALFAALNATVLAAPNSPQVPSAVPVFINELHYDNDLADVDEAVEIAGIAGTDLTDWSIVLYNGNGGAPYNTTFLTSTIPDSQNGCGIVPILIASIQNGAPDGLALVDAGGVVMQFLSYEGSFTAVGGPADGMISVNIGVSEPGTTPIGYSLQLTGAGAVYEDFTWTNPTTATFGTVNTDQTFNCTAAPTLGLSKSVDPATAVPYQSPVTYTVILQNSGAVDETAVLFTDTLPISTTFASWVEQPSGADEVGDEITWTGTVTAGESITFTFTADQTADYSETITNTAEFSGTVVGTAQAAFTVEDKVILVDMAVEKTGPVYGVVGESINYTAVISNNGVNTANNVLFTDTFPVEISYVSDNSGFVPANPSPNTYVWDLGTVDGGTAVTINLTGTITNTLSNSTLVTNTVAISTSSSDENLTNNTANAETILTPDVTIYDIQYTTDSSGDSPYKNQYVTTEGIVTANFGNEIFIQDGSGAWNGVMLYRPYGSLSVGDYIQVTGQVIEYFNMTEFAFGANTTVISSGNTVPAFEILPTGNISTEAYESVLVQATNATVTDENLGNGEWAINDSSGDVRVNDLGTYSYNPNDGDVLSFVRGPLNYSFNNFKIEPRNDNDIALGITISKDAPALVAPGSVFTYTITVENQIGYALTNMVISDVVPANTTFAYALDSGVESGGVVTWGIPNLPHANSISVQFAVTATNSTAKVVNDAYAIYADNYTDPTTGMPVVTYIGDQLYIYDVQGEGFVSPLVGRDVTVAGEVVADFQGNAGMRGFFMQDATGDGNMLTSDGIFVYDNTFGVDVNVGDVVTVTGEVVEYKNMTEIGNVTAVITQTGSPSIQPTPVTLPETTNGDLERYEGMWITLPQTMTVAQNYFQGQYGQVNLSSDGRLFQPTNVYTPTSAEAVALANSNALNYLTLDDGRTSSNPEPTPYISPVDGTLRAGDTTSGLMGVLDEGAINSSSTIDYRLQPLDTTAISFTRVNERTTAPEDVGGRLQIASFNVLNYFTTIDTGADICGPNQDLECRGADTPDEFVRQRTKIITAVVSIDADVVGLMEIENNETAAITDLVTGLNAEAGAGTYAFIDTGYIGGDAIKVAMIYQPANVTPVGTTAVLTDVFPFDTNTRPPLAQAFVENETGQEFIVVVNHFKSKGSPCDNDPDLGDGQGNCNLTRVQAANELVAWLKTDPTGTGDPDIFIIGDLNSYAQEDPITALKGHGYTNLIEQFTGTWAYSYVFDGQFGYLDHALASSSAQGSVTGVTEWHINADEPSALDYNNYNWEPLFKGDAYRASDHDPVLIGVSLKWITYMPIMFK